MNEENLNQEMYISSGSLILLLVLSYLLPSTLFDNVIGIIYSFILWMVALIVMVISIINMFKYKEIGHSIAPLLLSLFLNFIFLTAFLVGFLQGLLGGI